MPGDPTREAGLPVLVGGLHASDLRVPQTLLSHRRPQLDLPSWQPIVERTRTLAVQRGQGRWPASPFPIRREFLPLVFAGQNKLGALNGDVASEMGADQFRLAGVQQAVRYLCAIKRVLSGV